MRVLIRCLARVLAVSTVCGPEPSPLGGAGARAGRMVKMVISSQPMW